MSKKSKLMTGSGKPVIDVKRTPGGKYTVTMTYQQLYDFTEWFNTRLLRMINNPMKENSLLTCVAMDFQTKLMLRGRFMFDKPVNINLNQSEALALYFMLMAETSNDITISNLLASLDKKLIKSWV